MAASSKHWMMKVIVCVVMLCHCSPCVYGIDLDFPGYDHLIVSGFEQSFCRGTGWNATSGYPLNIGRVTSEACMQACEANPRCTALDVARPIGDTWACFIFAHSDVAPASSADLGGCYKKVICAPGTSGTGVTGCAPCPQGTYGSVSAGTGNTCSPCGAGYSTAGSGTAGSDTSACTVCAVGYYSRDGTASGANAGCTVCSTGYSTSSSATSGTDASACTVCAAGYSGTSFAGTSGCERCTVGKFSSVNA